MEKILLCIEESLMLKKPFAIYCKSGSKKVTAIFQDNTKDYTVDFSAKGFVFAPFAEGRTIFIPNENATVINAEHNEKATELLKKVIVPVDTEAKKKFEDLVAKSVQAIKSGKFEKLVCSRTEKVVLKHIDIIKVYKNMLGTYPNAFRYCFYHPDSGLWMGATPEQLLKVEEQRISTVALAGTQLYKEGEEAKWPVKEKQEQQFVTDYIIAGLNSYVSNINVSEPYTFRAGNIVHIKTDITGDITEKSNVKNVVATLHPTPAVCGLPKLEAQYFLIKNEDYDRKYYAGFLGEINKDFSSGYENKTDLFVNLRCMKINNNAAQLFIGCGITESSDPEKEFIETVNKSETMKKVLLS